MRVEHEYFREGAWIYLAAWDVHRAKLFGRCEPKSDIAPTDRLIREVMTQEPYKSANRVFWIMDNCSAHRGQKPFSVFARDCPNRCRLSLHQICHGNCEQEYLDNSRIVTHVEGFNRCYHAPI